MKWGRKFGGTTIIYKFSIEGTITIGFHNNII